MQDHWLDNLEAELADLRAQQATAQDQPSTAPGSTALGSQSAASSAPVSAQVLAKLDELKSELQASWSERDALTRIIHESETELKELRAKLSQASAPRNQPGQEFRTVTRTRMRAGPTTEAEEVAVLSQGAKLQVVDTVEDGTWYEIRLLGYAFHELLEPSPKE